MTEDEMVGWHTNSMDMGWSKLQGIVKDREAWRTAIHGAAESDTNQQLNNNSIKHIQLNLNSLFFFQQFIFKRSVFKILSYENSFNHI